MESARYGYTGLYCEWNSYASTPIHIIIDGNTFVFVSNGSAKDSILLQLYLRSYGWYCPKSTLFISNNSFTDAQNSVAYKNQGIVANLFGRFENTSFLNNYFHNLKQGMQLIEQSRCDQLKSMFVLSNNVFENISCEGCHVLYMEKTYKAKNIIATNMSGNIFKNINGTSVVYIKSTGHGTLPMNFNFNKMINSLAQYNLWTDIKASDNVSFNGTHNWWDTKEFNDIQNKIYDEFHDSALTKVTFQPYYTDPEMSALSESQQKGFNPDAAELGGSPDKDTKLKQKIYQVIRTIVVPKGITLEIPAGAVLQFHSSGIRIEGIRTINYVMQHPNTRLFSPFDICHNPLLSNFIGKSKFFILIDILVLNYS